MNIEAILSLITPLLIGLLVGVLIKRTLSLVIVGVALLIALTATGAISLTCGDLYDKTLNVLPKLWKEAHGWFGVLPYSSVSFLIGLAVGLWKG